MLRGPQTPGELRNRADRMAPFAGLPEVQAALDALATRPLPLVARLPRQSGMKECRYAHLLGGPVAAAAAADSEPTAPAEPVRSSIQADRDRLAALEREMAALREEWAAFKKQFE